MARGEKVDIVEGGIKMWNKNVEKRNIDMP